MARSRHADHTVPPAPPPIQHVSDRAVHDFGRVAKDKGLLTEEDKRIIELLNNSNPSGETIEERAKLMGQTQGRSSEPCVTSTP